MTPGRGPRRIVIAGGGSAGWMAAATLANSLRGDCAIELVESDEIGTVGVGEATIPPIKLFLQQLGLDEVTVMRATGATAKLGIEFVDWAREGERYFHPFGVYGIGFDQVPFHQWWVRDRLAGGAPLGDYSMGAAMAARGRFAHPTTEPRMVQSTFDYAYHLDAGLFAAFLRSYAEARGVVRTEGRIADVERDGAHGAIAALRLDDGRRVAGDFFIDCTGFASLLLGRALGVGYEDWSGLLPCDRAVAAACEADGPRDPFTRSTARAAGWQWRIPLQHRIGNGLVFASAHLSEDEACATLLATLEGAPLAAPRVLRFTTGRRRSFWQGNCLALGLAAGFMEPLESTSLHLVQSGVARFLALYPDGEGDAPAAAEYNRLTGEEYERIRDFLILHYHANGRRDGELWRYCREMALPDSLAYRIEQFRHGARLVSPGPELFQNASWLAVLIGQGVTPRRWSPLVDQRPHVPAADRLRSLRTAIAAAADAMPSHQSWLGGVAAANGARTVAKTPPR